MCRAVWRVPQTKRQNGTALPRGPFGASRRAIRLLPPRFARGAQIQPPKPDRDAKIQPYHQIGALQQDRVRLGVLAFHDPPRTARDILVDAPLFFPRLRNPTRQHLNPVKVVHRQAGQRAQTARQRGLARAGAAHDYDALHKAPRNAKGRTRMCGLVRILAKT